MSRLSIYKNEHLVAEHILKRASVGLGRHSENDIVLDDRTLSRFHARIERRGASFFLVDLGAQNGIFANGVRVVGEYELTAGVRVGLGAFVAVFETTSGAVSPAEIAAIDIDMELEESPETTLANVAVDFDDANQGLDSDIGEPTLLIGSKAQPVVILLYNGLEASRHLITIGEPLVIGRSKSADIAISLLGLSRRHTRLNPTAAGVVVEDLGSQNGTWVNNARIQGSQVLKHGDLLNFYEYGLLFLEDPNVEIGLPGATFQLNGDDALAGLETGQQAGIGVGELQPGALSPVSMPLASSLMVDTGDSDTNAASPLASPLATAVVATPAPLLSEVAGLAGKGIAIDADYDPFAGASDIIEDDYLPDEHLSEVEEENADQDAFDLATDDAFAGTGGMERPSKTQILLKELEQDSQLMSLDDLDYRGSAGAARDLPEPHGDRTYAAIQIPDGIGRGPWPTDDELSDALLNLAEPHHVSLEVFLDDRLYTQLPMSQQVTRVGTDSRCELALPPNVGLAGWQLTLVNFGGAVVCFRASGNARVLVEDVLVDQCVLNDGDTIHLGRIRIQFRSR